MKAKEFRGLSREELKAKLKGFRADLMKMRFDKAKGELKNLMKVKEARKNIARIMTLLNEKEGKEK